jgi:hypothetical protein
MGFLNPKKQEDEQLPGSGVSIDLDTKICPNCRREALPWEERCAECDEVPVPPDQVPATEMLLPPGLAKLAEENDEDGADDPVDHDEPPTAS